jgi:hypothetical protein
MKLIWGHGHGLVDNDLSVWNITERPQLSFQFDGMFYSSENNSKFKNINDGRAVLTDDELAEVIAYIQSAIEPSSVPLTTQQMIAENDRAIQMALDTMAQSRGYSNIKSACAYASQVQVVPIDDPDYLICEKFRLEGNALQLWMSLTWARAYNYLATVEANQNAMPTPEQAVEMMPAFVWPD